MKNYNKLKEIIQEANPEIMELNYGCEIILPNSEICKFVGKNHYKRLVCVKSKDRNDELKYLSFELWEDGSIIILGRPIRLADVLLAISKNHKWEKLSTRPFYRDGLQFERGGRLLFVWDLTKDFDNQEDKVKQSLTDLFA